MARRRAGEVLDTQDQELSWVCSRDPARARDSIRSLTQTADAQRSAPQTTSDWEMAMSRTDSDGVFIRTPNTYHYGGVKAALERGRHVFVEYPDVTKPSEGKQLLALARDQLPAGFDARVGGAAHSRDDADGGTATATGEFDEGYPRACPAGHIQHVSRSSSRHRDLPSVPYHTLRQRFEQPVSRSQRRTRSVSKPCLLRSLYVASRGPCNPGVLLPRVHVYP